ncbi:hypothetical protein ABZP36_012694 [Zizania latifolia]
MIGTTTTGDKIYRKMGEGTRMLGLVSKEMVAIKNVRAIRKYSDAAMIEIDVLHKIARNDAAAKQLSLLKEQCKHLVKEGNLLRKKVLRYKEIYETRGSNLKKAEFERETLLLPESFLSDFR